MLSIIAKIMAKRWYNYLTIPSTHYRSDVAGLDMAKEALKEAVIMPVRFPHMFQVWKDRPSQACSNHPS